jgi:hypothetical protein
VTNWISRPLTFCEQNTVGVRSQPDDVDLVLTVPPPSDFGIRLEIATVNRLPHNFLTDVFERRCDVIFRACDGRRRTGLRDIE